MHRNPRLWAIVLFTATAALLSVGFVRAQALGGWIGIQVRDSDTDFALRVPAALGRIALAFVPDHVFRNAGADAGDWGPTLHTALSQLDLCEDATFVALDSADESVRVRKSRGVFYVSVTTREERVEIRVPTGLVRVVCDRLADLPAS